MRVRFAPSPTGFLHVGNARTALFNWLLARRHGGAFILRIEDTDADRSTAEAAAGILRDVRWLGLDWDEGPEAGGSYGPYRQSERLHLYQAHARALVESARAYFCFCPPAQIDVERQAALAAGVTPRYSGRCRGLAAGDAQGRVARGEPAAIRFRVPERREVAFVDLVCGTVTFSTDVIGDPVILRADGFPAYNFAVVVDDALMEISHVVRGEDHLSNTPRQILFYEALGWAAPRFAHLPLVLGSDHSPLSKRHGATSVREFRERGYLAESLVNYLALVGWSPGEGDEILPLAELARRFSIDEVGHRPGVFDEEKLAWVNRQYLKAADPERLVMLALPHLARAGFAGPGGPGDAAHEYLVSVIPMAASSIDRLDQAAGRLRLLFVFEPQALLARDDVRAETSLPAVREVIETLAEDLARAPRLVDRETFRAAAERVRQRTGRKGKALLHPIRLALTAATEGPELDVLIPAIDRGADLGAESGLAPIIGCRERARMFAERLSGS